MAERSYKLDEGLQEQLKATIDAAIQGHVEEIKEEISNGIITERTAKILVAWRWLPSTRDPRLTKPD
jgi:hypothetical protein